MIRLAFAFALVWIQASGSAASYIDSIYPFAAEAIPTPATDLCPAPCYQVRMYLGDVTRGLDIQALLMNVDIYDGATPALMPVPPERNDNAAEPNAVYSDDESFRIAPWDLSSTLGRSPDAGFDVLMVHAAYAPFDLDSFADLRAQFPICMPEHLCATIEAADRRNLLYLGRFNVTRRTDLLSEGFWLRIGGISGLGHYVEDLQRLNGISEFIEFPEPAAILLVGFACSGVALVRRRGASLRD